jgi:predicted Zn-dependent peptidase
MSGPRARHLLLAACALAAPEAAPADERLHEWEVSPGTTGVLVEDHRVPLVALRIELPAGDWMPWFRQHHAGDAFEIQQYDPDGSLRKRSDVLAAELQLASEARASILELSCRTSELEAALELVRDVLSNRDFDRRELERWKAERRVAWQSSLKDPQFVLDRHAAELLFREGDPRRRPWQRPDPPQADVAQLLRSRDALVRLPGRIIGFAGDLAADEARALAAGLLPAVDPERPEGLTTRLEPIVPRAERPDAVTPRLPRLTQTYFAWVRESVALTDPDYPASLIADHVLGGHFNSRLMVALRHAGGETYHADVETRVGLEPGSYALTTFTRTGNAAATEAKLRDVLERFHADGISEAEREMAAGFLTGSRAFARQAPAQHLDEYLWERRLGLPRGFKDEMARRAAGLPLAEINEFIRRFHDPARFTMLRLEAAGRAR